MKLCMGCMEQMEDHLSTCPKCGFNEADLRQESYYLDPGTIIGGKYIIGRVISYGGHTISYLGMNAEINQKVMVKEYLPSDFSTRSEGEKEVTIYSGDAQEQFVQGLTNFLNEANRIQSLQNPEGITKVYDCIAENDTGYVVSEYVHGKTLKEILDSGKKYDVNEAKSFILQILKGLCKVHPLDIIHCDISPETIMVTDSGEIKLLDFGATRYVTTANSKSLAIILKQGYAPEEQYRSRGVRGPWTDVYALGAVMYRMITGIVPQESVERALEDELKEPSKLGISIPENVENALMNALNVYQSERTSSAEVFLRELNSSSVKRIKVKKKSNESGKFPTWAKVLVACMLCIIVAGGGFLIKIGFNNTGDLQAEDTLVLPTFKDKTIEAAEAELEKLGYDIKINKVDIYDESQEKNGTIQEQSIPQTDDLEDAITKGEAQGLTIKDGKVTGEITCYVYQNKKIKYSEIRGLNAYELSVKTNWGIKGNKFGKLEEAEGEYFEIKEIEKKDESTISIEDIENGDGDTEIILEDIKKIYYCANEFFYWEKFDEYRGKNINELSEVETYIMKNETTREKSKKKRSLANSESLVDDEYYTFKEGYEKGIIFWQQKEPGEKVDTSQGINGSLLKVVKQRFSWSGKTGDALKEELIKAGFSTDEIKFEGSGNGAHEISEIEVKLKEDSKKEEKVEGFFKEAEVDKIIITTVAPATVAPTPAPTPTPTPAPTPSPTPSQPQQNPTPDNDGFDT